MDERLKKLRKELNMNQKDFAKSIGLGQSTWAMIEVGKRELTERHVKTICAIHDVSEEWLRNGTGEMFKRANRDEDLIKWAGTMANPNNSKDAEFMKKFVHMLSKLDTNDWKTLEKLAVLMKEEEKDSDQT